MADDVRRFTFRLPVETFESVEKIAKANHRSVNSEIIIAIEEYLQKFQTEDSEPLK
ncbi:Arc family DNA-binding protein [Acidaminococcus timonensis]|uniref:Arc family DNA-binding protein n=1 Tax=Acidaminococcus timonensis TaxID=1871002 RepID=UPI00307B3800